MDELLTIKEVSAKLKTNVSSVYKLIKGNQLKSIKLGSIKIRASTLDRFIENLEMEQNNG
ncbi:helix-turn-helix domain-containing protein [Psychrilyobacter sp.]|uniref:helix-turn-helix domain-containing protein n=1 Tax=Psychrilyobacter sp. TaxID=2586924 RepID=UPI0030171E03